MAKETERVLNETIGAFKRLREEIKQYKDELTQLQRDNKQGTEEWAQAAKKLADAQKDLDTINKAAKGNIAAYNVEQVKSINDLKELIKLKNQERNAMDMSSKEYKEATEELKVLNDKLREAGTSAGDWRANVGNYTNSIKDAFSDLSTAATGLGGSIGGLNASMLKMASNPLGATIMALVSAIKLLADGIKSSEENTNRWNAVLTPLKAVLLEIQRLAQKMADSFLDFAENIKKSEGATNAFKGVLTGLLTIFNQTKTRIENLWEGIVGITKDLGKAVDKFKGWGKGLQETFEPVTKFVGNIYDSVKDKLAPVIDWIVDKYNQLASTNMGKVLGMQTIEQIKSGFDEAKKSAEDFTETLKENSRELENIANKEAAYAKQKRALLQEQARLEGEVAQYENDIQNARLNKDWAAAQDALNKKKEAANKLAQVGVSLAQMEYNIIRSKNALSDSNTKDLDAEANALAAIQRAKNAQIASNTQIINQEREITQTAAAEEKAKQAKEFADAVAVLNGELNKLKTTYTNVVSTMEKPIAPKGGDITKDSLDAYYDAINANARAEYDAYVALTEAKIDELERFIEVQREAGNDVAKQEIQLAELRREQTEGYAAQTKKMNDAINKSNEERADRQLALQKSELKGYANLMDSVSSLFEENTFAYKATATAKALINTYLAATSALAETPGGAVAKGVAMAATLAAGLAQVINIWKVKPSGENSVSTSTTTPAIAEPSVEETNPYSYTRQVQSFEEEEQLNKPIYVSVTDINNVQNRVKVTEKESSW